MHTIPEAGSITFDEYNRLAHASSYLSEVADPDDFLHKKVIEEAAEVFFERGLSDRFFYLFGFQSPDPNIKEGIAKEFGDILWLVNEYAFRTSTSIARLATEAVRRNGGMRSEVTSFSQLDTIAQYLGKGFFVRRYKNVEGISPRGDLSEAQKRAILQTNVDDNPGYVINRVLARLMRQVGGERMPLTMIPTNADLDDPQLIAQSPEDILWVMSTVATNYLDTSLAHIAVGNLVKLQRRQEAGTLQTGEDIDRSV